MSETMSIDQASGRLAELIHALGPRDEIILTENEQPIAKIVLEPPPRKERVPGKWKGMLTIISDDDEHLEDFKEYMP